jgi:hypothetical protein
MPRPTAIASWRSLCTYCEETIHSGDPIALSEPDGDWLHGHCAVEFEPEWPEEEEVAA